MEFHDWYGLLTVLLLVVTFATVWTVIWATSPKHDIIGAIKERGPSETITIHSDGTTSVKKHKCLMPMDDFIYCTGCNLTWQDRELADNHTCPAEA